MSDTLRTITESINSLTVASELLSSDLARQVRRLRLLTSLMSVVMLLMGALVAFNVYSVRRLQHLSTVAASNSATLAEVQTRTNNDVLCPLYTLFLRSYNKQSESYRLNPTLYDESFTTIEEGARILNCELQVRRGSQ